MMRAPTSHARSFHARSAARHGEAPPRRAGASSWLALAGVAALLLLTAVASARPAPNETPLDRELADAKEALVMGDGQTAVRLYESMYERAPDDPRVMWGLVRAYVMAGLDEERLIPLLKARLEELPGDERARHELGEAYARIGERDLAHETWTALLVAGEPNADRYSEIGALETQYRMYEQAVATYTDGRRRLASPSLFGQELAQAYTALGRFDDAIDECLLMVRDHPGLTQWGTNNVELMLDQGASRDRIEERMAEIVESDDATPATLAFAGSTYLAMELYDDALDAYVRADRLSGEQGAPLMEFAGILKDEGRVDEARRAYLMVVERYPGGPRTASAGIEAARLLASSGSPAAGVAELKAVAAGAGAGAVAGQALVEAARIELQTLHEPESALTTLAQFSDRGRGRKLEHEASLIGVDAELALGRFAEAKARAAGIVEGGAEARAREVAMYDVGYVAFLETDVRGSLDAFRAMVEESPAGSLVNDALRLMLVVSDADESGDTGPLSLLADAHAGRLRWDSAAARASLTELTASHGGTSAAVEGLMLLALVAEDDGDEETALAIYGRVVSETTSLAARAQAMLRSGELLEAAGRRDEALAAYTGVLEELPSNFLSGEARRRIDRLRRGGGLEG